MANEHLVYDGQAPQTPVGYTQKMHWCIVVDTSSSMIDHIKTVSDELKQLVAKVQREEQIVDALELSLIGFDSRAHILRGPRSVAEFDAPLLEANGTTNLVDGVTKAIQLVETRKQTYKDSGLFYYRPIICVLTDGLPWLENDAPQDLAGLKRTIHEESTIGSFVVKFFGTAEADINLLRDLSHPDYPASYIRNDDYPSIFDYIYRGIGFLVNSQETEAEYQQLACLPTDNEA